MKPPLIWKWTVDPDLALERADRALTSALSEGRGEWEKNEKPQFKITRSQIQKWLEEGRVQVQGKSALARELLSTGSAVRIEMSAPTAMELVPENMPLDILFQDEHIVVVNKPAGLTVHPSETQTTGTLVHALLHHVRDLSGIGGVARPGIVHRIDKDTSGVLVVTKTDLAHQKLSEVFAQHRIERKYWALVYGGFDSFSNLPLKTQTGATLSRTPTGAIRIESTLGRHKSDRKKMSSGAVDGRNAVTHIRELEAYGKETAKAFASWVEATLETGRTHQVRVHLADSGHSLLGDPVYGIPTSRHPKWLSLPLQIQKAVEAMPGQALHARVLGFHHPVTGEPLRFEAEPPEAFRLLLDTLKSYQSKDGHP